MKVHGGLISLVLLSKTQHKQASYSRKYTFVILVAKWPPVSFRKISIVVYSNESESARSIRTIFEVKLKIDREIKCSQFAIWKISTIKMRIKKIETGGRHFRKNIDYHNAICRRIYIDSAIKPVIHFSFFFSFYIFSPIYGNKTPYRPVSFSLKVKTTACNV